MMRENPFADYGKIVRGDRFIGRKKMIGVIENRIIRPVDPGNLAIIGMHRIGKSSLAYKTIVEQKERLIAKRVLPIWMGLSSYDQPANFFRSLITECVHEMEDLNWLSEQIRRLADRVLEVDDPWDQIKRFFYKVREAGYASYQTYLRQKAEDFAVFDRLAEAFKDADNLQARIDRAVEEVKSKYNRHE